MEAFTLDPQIRQRLQAGRTASIALRAARPSRKNEALETLAGLLGDREARLIEANRADLQALPGDTPHAFRDRLTLNPERIAGMIESLRQVAALPDPVGSEVSRRTLENGLLTRQVRAPLGVILMIFESRPNVAIEAFSLAFKSGNVILLKGGKESMRTTGAIYALMSEALQACGFPVECFWGITDPDRRLTQALLQESRWIDVVVPRGGDRLIEFVVGNSRIPIIKNDRGLCHVYVHEDAEVPMALEIATNAKTHRPGVCNAMETLLVHRSIAPRLLPALHDRISAPASPHPVEWFGCPETVRILAGRAHVGPAQAGSFDTEYLDYRMSARVVDSLGQAIAHIEEHGSRHSEAIVTGSESVARVFQSEVDAAAVYWNASTRFTDGFQLGLGGELGISTQKLHVRGPVGLNELTSVRWVIDGKGQVRK